MKKPYWKPDVDRIAGWILHAESEHFTVVLRPGLSHAWEWVIRSCGGVYVQRNSHAELVEAVSAAEAAWEDLPNG